LVASAGLGVAVGSGLDVGLAVVFEAGFFVGSGVGIGIAPTPMNSLSMKPVLSSIST
jgi:hypothetical protein